MSTIRDLIEEVRYSKRFYPRPRPLRDRTKGFIEAYLSERMRTNLQIAIHMASVRNRRP